MIIISAPKESLKIIFLVQVAQSMVIALTSVNYGNHRNIGYFLHNQWLALTMLTEQLRPQSVLYKIFCQPLQSLYVTQFPCSTLNNKCLALFCLHHSLSLRTVGSADKLAPSGGTSTMGKFSSQCML